MQFLWRIQSCLVIGVSLILFVLCYTEPVLYQLGPFNCEKCIHQPECSWCQKNHPCVNTTSTINKISSDAPSLPLSRRYLGANSDASDNSSDNIFKNHHAQSTNVEYQDLMDGYSNQQWALDMIKVPDVWSQGIFGRGVRVRVNDDGVEEANPHWKDRFDIGGSCDNQGEYLSSSSMEHGTSVASIIGASNELDGTCTLGVAPSITLSSCYALAPSEAFLGEKVEAMDISSNSFERPACKSNSEDSSQNRNLEFTEEHQCPFSYYDFRPEYDPCLKCGNFSSEIGYNDKYGRSSECIDAIVEHCNSYYEVEKEACSEFLDLIIGGECSYVGLSTVARDSIIKGITEGRGGKGIIYVFASGNSYFTGDDTNVKGYTSTRMTITVGAVGADERHAYYSTAGASLFISAPGGDVDDDTRHFTAAVGGGCHSSSVGTSFAAPLVSGVVAMMLEVNPNLGWRDVQGILAKSARPVTEDPSDDSATVNGAGMWVSNYYGFGILDAAAAVELSRTWAIYAEERLIAKDSGILDFAVYDDASAETVSSIIITETIETPINQRQAYAEFVVEAVEVLLDISHFSRGDLRIRLVSPSGTESILHPGYLPENSQPGSDQPWKLMTIRNWGESPYGEWKLAIVDEKAGDLDVCVDEPGYHLYYSDNTEVTCPYIEKAAICTNGGYNPNFFDSGNYESLKTLTDSDGRTIEEACCVCGGGVGRDAFRDSLHHWTIAIYGREEYLQTKLATFLPTTRPSQSPTSFPSDLPTDAPTVPPTHPPNTIFPTLSPILSPTLIPSAAPMTQSPTMSLTPSEDGYPSQDPSLAASYDPSDLPTTTTSSNTAIPQGSSNPTIPQGSSNPTMNPLSFSTNSTDPYSMSPSSAPFTFDGSSMPSLAPSNSADVGGTDSTSSNTGINDTVGNRTASNGGDGEPTPAPSSSTSPTPKMGHAQQGSYSMRGSSSSRSSSSSTVSIKSDMTLWILLFWMAKTVLETL